MLYSLRNIVQTYIFKATYLPAVDQVPYIEPYEVCEKMVAINPFKTCCPDNIPGRILKEFAHLKSDIWKFVDDVTLFERLERNVESSAIQFDYHCGYMGIQ